MTSSARPKQAGVGEGQVRVPHPAETHCPSPLSPGGLLGPVGGRQVPALSLLRPPFLPPLLFYLIPIPALPPSLPHPCPCLVPFPALSPSLPHFLFSLTSNPARPRSCLSLTPIPACPHSCLSLSVLVPASSLSPLVPVPASSPSLLHPHPRLMSPAPPRVPIPACPLFLPVPTAAPPPPGVLPQDALPRGAPGGPRSPGKGTYLLRGLNRGDRGGAPGPALTPTPAPHPRGGRAEAGSRRGRGDGGRGGRLYLPAALGFGTKISKTGFFWKKPSRFPRREKEHCGDRKNTCGKCRETEKI